jgi:hypothetical protein
MRLTKPEQALPEHTKNKEWPLAFGAILFILLTATTGMWRAFEKAVYQNADDN